MLFIFLFVVITVISLYYTIRSPFKYPYFMYSFDVSGKRKPDIHDYLDVYLINNGLHHIQRYEKKLQLWKDQCDRRISRSIFKNHRYKQYIAACDDEHAYRFDFKRSQTRYRQRNYIKTAYKVMVKDGSWSCDYRYLKNRYDKLADIDFACTLKDYHSKDQRKLCTRDLRVKVMKRDNYTCQCCGKYMPDEVGLQIDHIVPVAKGGKSVMSNLQVLCSKCNGSKSSKIILKQNAPKAVMTNGDRIKILKNRTFTSVYEVMAFVISDLKVDSSMAASVVDRGVQSNVSPEYRTQLVINIFCKLIEENKI